MSSYESASYQKLTGSCHADADLVQHMDLRSVEHLHLLQTNGATARSLMLRHNLRLIVHVAQRYADRGVDRSVLVEVRGLSNEMKLHV